MPRYVFKVQANGSAAVRAQLGADAQAFIDANPTMFPFPPQNEDIGWHGGLTVRLIRGDIVSRQALGQIFDTMKQALINRGAIAPSSLWLKVQADQGGVTESISAANPDPLGGAAWTEHKPAIDS